jgi:glycosyltransferase involved in cell wall biosynthesis
VKILLVSSKYLPEYSGSGFRAHNLYRRLSEKFPEIEVSVLCGSETENTCADYEYEGFKVSRIAGKVESKSLHGGIRNALNFRSESSKTRDFLRQLSSPPDLIHVFGKNYVTATVTAYARMKNIPCMVELVNEMDNPFQYVPFPYRLWFDSRPPENCRYICISERLEKVCLQHGIQSDCIWTRPNPVNETIFKPVDSERKYDLRQRLCGFSKEDKLLVYVAKYIPRKNHRFLLDVLEKLPPEYKLFLGGPMVESGSLMERDQKIFDDIVSGVKDKKLDGRVEIKHGFIENIQEYYQMADVYMFPTLKEGLGTPMLECIACGVPVAANIIPGITDSWVRDGENGYLSELDAENFASVTEKAAGISREKLTSAADEIMKVAGTEVIDQKYFDIMKEITGK